MDNSIRDFLEGDSSIEYRKVSGHFVCMECDASVYEGRLNEDTGIMTFTCDRCSYESEIKLYV
jgi:DNA-directed RNA polymerase subunit RPC12/RpoP